MSFDVDEVDAVRTPPGYGLPQWPHTPPPVDASGSSFLIITVGGDAQAAQISRRWVYAAGAVGATRHLRLDTLADAADRFALGRALDGSLTGTRILVTGGQCDVMLTLALARRAGAIGAELSAFVAHTRDLAMYCAHCRDTHRIQGAAGDVVECPGCGRRLEIHPHHSATRGSFLASAWNARDLVDAGAPA